ncbi:hypothetical protein ABZP36_024651 [Zizania latifolia]
MVWRDRGQAATSVAGACGRGQATAALGQGRDAVRDQRCDAATAAMREEWGSGKRSRHHPKVFKFSPKKFLSPRLASPRRSPRRADAAKHLEPSRGLRRRMRGHSQPSEFALFTDSSLPALAEAGVSPEVG